MDKILKEFPFRCRPSLKPLIDYLEKDNAAHDVLRPCQGQDLREMIKKAPELIEPIDDLSVLERHGDLVRRLMSLVFAPVSWDTDALAAVVPFSIEHIFISPQYRRLFLDKDGVFQGRRNVDEERFRRGRAIRAYLFILEKFYDIHIDFDYPLLHIVPDPATGMDRYFKIKFDFRFVEAHALKEPKPLTSEERESILKHVTEPDVLREVLSPADFELHGFTVFQAVDVTEFEIISELERNLIDQDSIVSEGAFHRLQGNLRTLFRRPDLVASLDAIQQDHILRLNSGCEMNHCCIFADTRHIPVSEFAGTVYEKAVQSGEIQLVSDFLHECSPKCTEEELLRLGVRSMMLAPLHYQERCIGILHIGSPRAGDLGPMDALLMSHLQPLFSMAIRKALDDLDNRIQGVIKEKCTAIHPTVEWRFREAAVRHLENMRRGRSSGMGPIVFKGVYPLYGISDIRGSSRERNKAIQKDLIDHLTLALKVIASANEYKPTLILQELAGRIQGHLERIRAGLGTGDEISVVNFLREEVESIFPHLKGFGLRVNRAIKAYVSAVDPNMGTIYGLRKEFEESVSVLGQTLTAYLDTEEADAQTVFPHYFEKHRTDGVDYLIYMGASLMEKGEFNEIYLKNLRLWQLKLACGMAWHTEQLKSSLKVPLDTAHLILVQNAPLSIRFRFDEKRFDADGTYDIRHEIIKSRLDKATIKGREERLTQPGKIAVVYSQVAEAQEMQRHIDFLRSEGYLTGETENLELENLPGVIGLNALRVEVDLESGALSKRVKTMSG